MGGVECIVSIPHFARFAPKGGKYFRVELRPKSSVKKDVTLGLGLTRPIKVNVTPSLSVLTATLDGHRRTHAVGF